MNIRCRQNWLVILVCGGCFGNAAIAGAGENEAAVLKVDGFYASEFVQQRPFENRTIIRLYPDNTAIVTSSGKSPGPYQGLFGKHNSYAHQGFYVLTDGSIRIEVEYQGTKILHNGLVEGACLLLMTESRRPNGKVFYFNSRKTRYCFTGWDYHQELPPDVKAEAE
jgi:hypothetical protein